MKKEKKRKEKTIIKREKQNTYKLLFAKNIVEFWLVGVCAGKTLVVSTTTSEPSNKCWKTKPSSLAMTFSAFGVEIIVVEDGFGLEEGQSCHKSCLLYTSPSPRD